jgi:hypothetical protein
VQLFTNPFLITPTELAIYPVHFQMEVLELQNHVALHGKFRETLGNPSSQKFASLWKLLPKTDFPNLIEFALRYSCRFGSTYICEQTFSTMNFIKNKYRAVLTDEHLKNLILLESSQIDPNIEKLTQMKQIQKPH